MNSKLILALLLCSFGWRLECQSNPAVNNAPLSIEQFVKESTLPIPYNQARRYGREQVPKLLEMLRDRQREAYWPAAIHVLGLIGDESAYAPLVQFLQNNEPPRVSPTIYDAKIRTVLALGHLAFAGSRESWEYLLASLEPGIWQKRNIRWLSDFDVDETDRNQGLTQVAVVALGLSGRPEAKKKIQELKGRKFGLWRDSERVFAEAQRAYRIVSRKGLAGYYPERR